MDETSTVFLLHFPSHRTTLISIYHARKEKKMVWGVWKSFAGRCSNRTPWKAN